MWKYIIIWTFVNVVSSPCPDAKQFGKKGLSCMVNHRSYNYERCKIETTDRHRATFVFDSLVKEQQPTPYYGEAITKVKIDSIFIEK